MTDSLPDCPLHPDTRVALRPDPLRWPADAGAALLAAGPAGFDMVELWLRQPDEAAARRLRAPVAAVTGWAARQGGAIGRQVAVALERLTAPRTAFAGIAKPRPLIMGIVNVTPDSFSDGGDHATATAAIAHGHALVAAGADLLDIGGESTRPGSDPVPETAELARVIPVIEGLKGCGVPLSIDSCKAGVMRRAVAAGATIINDVRALEGDPEALAAAADSGAWIILMHCLGEPKTMQDAPVYRDVVLDIFAYLEGRIVACEKAGIARQRIAVDPGIGFGKTLTHNVAILSGLGLYQSLGCPVLLGVSRKSFIGRLDGSRAAGMPPAPKERLGGSLAAALTGLDQGVDLLRVHDVAQTVQALSVWRALHGFSARDTA